MRQTDIQQRLYKAILLIGAGLSVISITGNCFSGFPFLVNLKWIALFAITVLAFAFANNERTTKHLKFFVFAFLILIFLPFAYVDSGGSINNAIGYVFLLLITTTYLFDGWRRIFLVSALIVTFAAMHVTEYYYPEIFPVYPGLAQFIDRMIQIPLILIASFVIILNFAKEYERVNRKLNQLAERDELTGLYNRRMFDKALDEAFLKKEKSVQLAFLDLNNFKKVNDRCGHAAGDKALVELAALMRNAFEPGKHIVSRWGGDEFAIIYFGEKEAFSEKLEKIRADFGAYVTVFEKTAGITTSVVSLSDYDAIPQMFIAADKQLYENKQTAMKDFQSAQYF